MKFIIAFVLLLAVVSNAARTTKVISTSNGPIRGSIQVDVDDRRVAVFADVPYAVQPTGELRFKRASLLTEMFEGVRDFTAEFPSSVCPQFDFSLGPIGEEECLKLDIYIPMDAPGGRLPIQVYFYGGGLSFGTKSGFLDPRRIALNTNTIVVAVGYRVGALGFMALPELAEEDGDSSTGNMGLQDQQVALRWIQENAKKMGGDKDNVSIFGPSSGGTSVCWHLVNENSAGLFDAAAMVSGSCQIRGQFQPVANMYQFWGELSRLVGCTQGPNRLSCLRGLPKEALAPLYFLFLGSWQAYVTPAFPIVPTCASIDGTAAGLKDYPINLLSAGDFNDVPVLMGGTQNEGIFFSVLYEPTVGASAPYTENEMRAVLGKLWDFDSVDNIMGLYAPTSAGLTDWTFPAYNAVTDATIACPLVYAADAITSNGGTAYVYQFDYPTAFPLQHGADMPYLFDVNQPPSYTQEIPEDKYVSDAFQNYIANMARCGAPNCPGEREFPEFEPWDVNTQRYMTLTFETSMLPDFGTNHNCVFWSQQSYHSYYA